MIANRAVWHMFNDILGKNASQLQGEFWVNAPHSTIARAMEQLSKTYSIWHIVRREAKAKPLMKAKDLIREVYEWYH